MVTKSEESVSREIDAGARGFVFRFPYNAAVVDVVRGIEGRRYDPGTKTWTVPLSRATEVSTVAQAHSFALT